MLSELRVKNFLLIEEARLCLDGGLNVLSGETGHGKSILVDAFTLLLGERASPQIVRDGAREAYVEAVFDLSGPGPVGDSVRRVLSEAGVGTDEEDGEKLLLKRIIRTDGRSQAYINGSPVLVKTLKEIGDLLVDIHGQHEHQSLLNRSVYLDVLDAFAAIEKDAQVFAELHAEWKEIRERLRLAAESEQARNRRMDEIERQLEEIDGAEISPGEEDRLKAERKKLQHAEQLSAGAAKIHALLYEGGDEVRSATDLVGEAEKELTDMLRADESLQGSLSEMESARVILEEVSMRLSQYGQSIEFDPETQAKVDERLFALQKLKSKYGSTVEAILDYADSIREELLALRKEGRESKDLDKQLAEVEAALVQAAQALSSARDKAAKSLCTRICGELEDLGLGQSKVEIDLARQEDEEGPKFPDGKRYRMTARGVERADILLSPNPGQKLATLREAASGGEISRIMLALKAVLAKADHVPTLVFDEIDIGIGGKAAQSVATKLKKVSESHQVICITHLAAIASKADRNFSVRKEIKDGRTYSYVDELTGEERTKELTRMLTGTDSEASRKIAETLLE